uniref:Epidermal patterning factor-like protein n=1 Tax=Oryza glaberrima TaxID=4538 RepID=I1PF12_ORYGL
MELLLLCSSSLLLLLLSSHGMQSTEGGELHHHQIKEPPPEVEQTGGKGWAAMSEALIGSRPPRCEGKCAPCGRCEAVQVPFCTNSAIASAPLLKFSTKINLCLPPWVQENDSAESPLNTYPWEGIHGPRFKDVHSATQNIADRKRESNPADN